jgi:TfoX/Sxy family transcriptional regulator of competence genes
MAYDPDLADRLREALAREAGITEKPMFGGLAFLIGGHMVVGVSSQGGLLLRVDPARTDELLTDPLAARAVMRGREVESGWLRVDVDAEASDAELGRWVREGVEYVRRLGPK